MTTQPDSGRTISHIDLPAFDDQATKIIRQLEAYGWTFTHNRKSQAVRGKAPDGVTVATIGRALAGDRGLKDAQAVVKRWERALAEEVARQETVAVDRVVDAIGTEERDEVLDAVLLGGALKHASNAVNSALASRVTEVSRKPRLARKGSDRSKATTSLYESGAVTEVLYSDGSVMFECSFGCGYSSLNAGSVAAHFRRHVMAGETTPVAQLSRTLVAKHVPVDPETMSHHASPEHREYTPSERVLAELTTYLTEWWHEDVTTEDVAAVVLTWFHDRRAEGEPHPFEPLTDEQIVQRIRLLVGGRDPLLEEEHQRALEALEEQRVAQVVVEEQLQVALAEVERIQGDLAAWVSLAPQYARPDSGPVAPPE